MIETKVQAVDAVEASAATVQGIGEALDLLAARDGSDFVSILATVAYEQSEHMRDVAQWLEESSAD